ncbi:hypothetical protein [Pandoraea norimbergensis]|uniref:Uncharacterized protein n=1 Tax=Pandoraea norimbergensis TaxID=93219 RepID=A0ABN4JGW6_9BURK|nr:hypothetical protein [Pandoraea norimbergensis]ALS60204.1 hypothetical protein AT302_10920 [Pandoraea norimbergensis]
MLPTPSTIAASKRCDVCQRLKAAPSFEYLDHVARSQRGTPILNRTPSQLSCLKLVLDMPYAALRAEHLINTGMPPEGATDLVARLSQCPAGELQRRIQATPTLRDWFDHIALQSPDGLNNDSLILSLRVLQLFAHPTSVPVVFDPIRRTVSLFYAPGRAPQEGAVPADGTIPRTLLDATASLDADSPAFQASRHALDLLIRTNDIDGRRQRSPFWQCDSDDWWHGGDVVRSVSTQLTPEFETWLEARRDTAVSHSFFHTHRELIAANARRRNETLHPASE